jgi:hypothetical protein
VKRKEEEERLETHKKRKEEKEKKQWTEDSNFESIEEWWRGARKPSGFH